MIKSHIEQTIKSIEAEKAQAVSVIKERVLKEKIMPFNSEIDSARTKALAEIDTELNQRMSELKQEYEVKKQELVKLGETKKKQNEEAVLASELAVVAVDYDATISKLTAMLTEISE